MSSSSPDPNRRRVLGLAAGLAGGLAAPAVARADAPVTWRMATAWPRDARGGGVNARRLADLVGALSGGRLSIQLFGAGEVVGAAELFDAVSDGRVQIAHGTSADWTARDPAFHFFSGVPFGLTGHEHAAWLRFGGGLALWRRSCEPFGVVPFHAGSLGVPAAGWFVNPVAGPEDVAGIAMRASGLSGELWRRLGAGIVPVPRDDVVAAFESGAIVAAEFMGPWRDYDLGLAGVAKNYYVPGFRPLGPAVEVMVNRAAYDSLSSELKAAVRAAAAAAATETYADFTYNNINTLPALEAAGVTVRELPEPIVRAAAREAAALIAEIAAQSPIAGEAHRSFVEFRKRANAYAAAGDEAALRLRKLALDS